MSLTPLLPLMTVAVYVVEAASAESGVNVALSAPALYATEAESGGVGPGRRTTGPLFTVDGSRASLNLAVTVAPVATAVPPFTGVTLVTVGGVVSGPTEVANTTSTQ